ncbi:MAG: T9SS type A sorting domain-containing protein [Bacteroidota bacterium]
MKYIFPVVPFTLLSINCYGQYRPMVSLNAKWFEFFNIFAGDAHNYTHVCKGDTSINQLLYRKIEHTRDRSTSPDYLLFLREDSISKKIFYFSPQLGINTEILLYDYSLHPGDTFTHQYSSPTSIILDSIVSYTDTSYSDIPISLTIPNPNVFYFHEQHSSSFYPIVWVEGIGSLAGLTTPTSARYENGNTLICHFDSLGNHDYYFKVDHGTGICKDYSSQEEIMPLQTVSIFPNPFIKYIHLKWNGKDLLDINVRNQLGDLIYSTFGVCRGTALDLEHYADGMYFIEIVNPINNQSAYSKIVKRTNF